jgi:methionine sulfoxide reductase heme-binding subunit
MEAQTIHLLLRVTARISFLFFLGAFTAPALFAVWPAPVSRWLSEKRRSWILAFAASHTVHLALIVTLAMKLRGTAFLHQVGWVTLIGGGTVYAFIYVLAAAAASPAGVGRVLSPRFLAFVHYLIWFIFASSFVEGAVRSVFYLPFAATAITALGLRLFRAWQTGRTPALSTIPS